MTVQTMRIGRGFGLLSLLTALTMYLLIVIGGIVRVTGSGLGCPDWPQCHGQWIPPLEGAILIEYSHRLAAFGVSWLLLATTVVAWWRYRRVSWIVLPVSLAFVLLIVQIVLGGITVLFELPPTIVTAHLGTALLLLAMVLTATVAAFHSRRPAPTAVDGRTLAAAWRFSRHIFFVAVAVFGLLLTGAMVAGAGASWACPGVPVCGPELRARSGLAELQMFHRIVATTITVVLAWMAVRAWRLRRVLPGVGLAGPLTVLLALAQIGVGVAGVLANFPPSMQGLHLAVAAALWACVAVLTALARLGSERLSLIADMADGEPTASTGTDRRWGGRAAQRAGTYFALVKPRIIVLLLITTFAAMILAQGGWPPLHLTLLTLLGGALAAGGANAINQYVDRDIDELMSRTRGRPLPSHAVAPARALAFGIGLGLFSFVLLGLFVNGLAAFLAITGLLFYVIVYTIWLKRATPQNIVIGGAAGAIPPLVGWAAVTGSLSLPALYLFAIIFFWTPPHFWALSLLLKKDYAAARIPMLPVISGEAETKRQIILYSVLLVAVTLLMFAGRLMGLPYLAAALVLGGLLIACAVALARGAERLWARRLFFYSNAYLALLFLAMIVDNVILKASAPASIALR